MQGLIGTFNSILKISELEANTDFRAFIPVDVRQILTDLVEFYEPIASEKQIVLTHDIHESVMMMGERNLLTQAFANLLDNALKFTPQGGHVSLSAKRENGVLDLVVADTGTGIPEIYHDKVFEKFFRLEASRNTQGNGLGLSLVAAIARIHGAEVWLEDNHPGLRVHFRVSL